MVNFIIAAQVIGGFWSLTTIVLSILSIRAGTSCGHEFRLTDVIMVILYAGLTPFVVIWMMIPKRINLNPVIFGPPKPRRKQKK